MEFLYTRLRLGGYSYRTIPALFLFLVVLFHLVIPSTAQTFSLGDLLIGFRDTDAVSDVNYLINLGQATKFDSLSVTTLFGTNGVENTDYGDDLRNIYGNNWFSSPTLSWTLYAQYGGRTNQYVASATASITDSGEAKTRKNPSSLGTANQTYSTLGGTYYNSNLNQPYNGDPVALGTAVLASGEWTDALGTLGNYTTETAIASDTPILSLYKAIPSTTANLPALHLGYFSINNLGIITYTPKSMTGAPGDYPGPWNWSAGSGSWDGTNNWTSNQVASNSYAVGITGAGGTITNNAVTNLSSLTFSNGAGSYTLTGTNDSQALTITGGITNNSAATQMIDLSITGAGGVTQSGTGTTVLSRSNSFIGGTTLSSGAVVIGNNNAFGSGAVTVSGASSLIAGVANLSTSNAMALNAATTFDTAANRWTNAGTLSGSGSLTKIGSGTLTIAGTGSTFTGNTALNSGALQVASGSSLGTGTVTVASGASLSGSGTVGGVLVQSNGILTSGVDGAVGKLTVSGDMTFSAGSILNWKLADANGSAGSGYDSFDVKGLLNLTSLASGSTLQFNILNAIGGTTNFLNNQNSQWLVASTTNSIAGFSTNDFTISTAGFTNALGGGAFGFITNSTGLFLKFTALGVDPWSGNLAAGSQSISGQTITSASNTVIGASSSRNGSVSVTNNGVWNVQGNLQVGGSTNGSGTLTIGSGGRVSGTGLTISDQKGSKGLVLITNGASSNAISLGSGTLSFGVGNGTLQFAQSNAVTISNVITGKGTISSTGTGTTTLSGNQSGFTGTNYLSSGRVVLATGATNEGTVNIAGKNASFNLNTNAVLSSTSTHAVAGMLLDNSGLAFNDSIKGSVALSPTGVLQKTYAATNVGNVRTNVSIAGFGAGIGAGKSFSILTGTATANGADATTIQAKIVNGQLDFHGTSNNAIVMQMKDPSYSTIRNQIQWFNTNVPVGQKGYWTNTTAGNGMNGTTANVSYGVIENMLVGTNKTLWNETKGGFTGSFNTFLLGVNGSAGFGTITNRNDLNNLLEDLNALSGNMIESYLNKIMGAFGYDNATKTSWAVINHNSIFGDGSATFTSADLLNEPVVADLSVFNPAPADVQAVPEPGTWALMVLGAGALILAGRRRKAKKLKS